MKLIQSLAISDPAVTHATVTCSTQYGIGVFSWHSSEADAEHNADITSGFVATITRDSQGWAEVPPLGKLVLESAGII